MKQTNIFDLIPKSNKSKFSVTRHLYINHKRWPRWYYGKRDIKEQFTIWLNKYYEVLRAVNTKAKKTDME